jgi:hypothetical protein
VESHKVLFVNFVNDRNAFLGQKFIQIVLFEFEPRQLALVLDLHNLDVVRDPQLPVAQEQVLRVKMDEGVFEVQLKILGQREDERLQLLHGLRSAEPVEKGADDAVVRVPGVRHVGVLYARDDELVPTHKGDVGQIQRILDAPVLSHHLILLQKVAYVLPTVLWDVYENVMVSAHLIYQHIFSSSTKKLL